MNASGVWSSAANWSGGVPNGPGDVATLGPIITSARTITLDAPFTVGGLVFDSNRGYVVSGTNALTMAVSAGFGSIAVTANGTPLDTLATPVILTSPVHLANQATSVFTLSGGISGSGELSTTWSGPVTLSGDNHAWSGGLTVGAGTLRLGYAPPATDAGPYKALGIGSVRVAAGATLDLDLAARVNNFKGSVVNAMTLSGAGNAGAGALRVARGQGTVLSGSVTLQGGATLRVDAAAVGSAFALMLGDPSTGAGGLGGDGGLVLLTDPSLSKPAPVQLNVRSLHAGGTVLNGTTLEVSPLGSLVGTGDVVVNPKSTLRLTRPAGIDAATASVSPNAVLLKGGMLDLGVDADVGAALSPASTGGLVAVDGVSFTNGGSKILDFDTLPAANALYLTSGPSGGTVAAGVTLRPESATHTLRFGGGPFALSVDATIADVGGVATNVEHGLGGTTVLTAANSYTGKTVITGGSLHLGNPLALGSGSGTDADGTELASGELALASGLELAGERIRLTGSGQLSAFGAVVKSPIVVEKGGYLLGGDYQGEISGGADFSIGSVTVLRGANTFTGTATMYGGQLEVRDALGLGSVSGPTVIAGGDVRVYAASAEPITVQTGSLFLAAGVTHAERITVAGGTLTSDPAAPFAGTIEAQAGTITVDLVSNATLVKTGVGSTKVTKLGAGYDGTIVVQQGKLSFFGDVLGSTVGSTVIGSPTGAYLEFTGSSSAEPIDLNNGFGTDLGALVCNSSFPAVLSGPIALGNKGAAVGIQAGSLTLSGPVSGGDLTVNHGLLTLTSGASTFAGRTIVNGGATVLVAGNGTLATTGGLYVAGGTVRFDNHLQPLADRVPDSTPITLASGRISVDTGTESVGPVSLERGISTIDVHSTNGPADIGSLTIASLARNPGAIAQFTATLDQGDFSINLGVVGAPSGGRIFFATLPALNDGMIGGWARIGGQVARFASYGPTGVVALVGSSADVNAATPSTNVELPSSSTLTAGRTINSLRVATTAQLDLAGNTLTVDSGGVLTYAATGPAPASNVSNGTIVPGPSSGGELFLYGGSIAARIADGPGGPTSVTTSGMRLSGANTYTGATRVTGVLTLDAPGALPAGTDLVIEGDGVFVNYTSTTPIKLGAVRLGGTTYSDVYFGGGAPLEATSYDADAGRFESGLVGGGALTKHTAGFLKAMGDNSRFTGPVDIQGGTLQVSTLGTGPVTVGPQSTLLVANGLDNAVLMNGGALASATSSTVPIRGAVRVTADARFGKLDLSGPVTVDAGVTVLASASLSGDLRVDGRLMPDSFSTVTVAPAPGRTVGGGGSIGSNVVVGPDAAVAPGGPSGAPGATGTLSVTGTYAQATTGALVVDVAPAASVGAGKPYAQRADRLDVGGAATLAGTLKLSLLDGGVPATGESFRVLTAAARSGQFDRYVGLVLGSGSAPSRVRYATPTYDATGVTLVVGERLLGDATLDGRTDFNDLVKLAQNYNSVIAGGDPWLSGDFTGDGAVDFNDLVKLAQNYNTGVPGAPIAGASAAFDHDLVSAFASVPEPSVLVLLAGCAIARRRRRYDPPIHPSET